MTSYYVYELIDPRSDAVFYVGKGKKDRRNQHLRDARQGILGRKCDLIREILAAGLEPSSRVIKRFSDESLAYEFEKRRIAEIGLENLTNLDAGGGGCTQAAFTEKRALQTVELIAKIARRVASSAPLAGELAQHCRQAINTALGAMTRRVVRKIGRERAVDELRTRGIFIEFAAE